MKKNVIWWPAIKNENHNDKYGNFEYFEYSKKTWQHFCKRFNCEFVEFTVPYETDFVQYRPQWQKCLYVFDELERRGIEYDQIALVDSTAMVRWNCPNFFELTNRKFCAWADIDNLSWTYQSVQGYKNFFNGFEFDMLKYFNSGFLIFNDSHKWFFNKIKELYTDRREELVSIQDSLRKGNDQTPINYLAQIYNLDVDLSLPPTFNLRHLNRREMLGYNWQLNNDSTPFFIKYGYIYRSTGLPKDQRNIFMKQAWDMTSNHYVSDYLVLDQVNHKDFYKNSTSRKFKEELITFFKDKKLTSCIEFGCCQGDTTKVLSTLFDIVYASDLYEDNVNISKNKCDSRTNIKFEVKDVNDKWEYENIDAIYLDALHDMDGILRGLNRCRMQYPEALIIMDDYGHIMNTVKPIIQNLISNKQIEVLQWIGEDKGFRAANGKVFIDKEGLIFKFNLS